MARLLKKVLATLSCLVLIGQTMLTSVAFSEQETISFDLDATQGDSENDSNNETPSENPQNNEGTTSTNKGEQNSNDTNNETPTNEKPTSSECSSEVISNFANSLSEIINDNIKNSDNSDFIRAEPSADNSSIILYVKNEDVKIPDLKDYIVGLSSYILGDEPGEAIEKKIWYDLVSKNEGLLLDISNVVNLVNISLGSSNELIVGFKDCSFTLDLELKVDDSNSEGGDNESSQCSDDVKSNLTHSLSEIINSIIKNSNSSGFKRAEPSADNNSIILYVENENVKIPDLKDYISGLTSYILGNEPGKDIESNIWFDLVSKNEGLLLDISNVVNLVNISLGSSNELIVRFKDCSFTLDLVLKIDDSNSDGNNGGNGGNGNGYSGGGGSSSGGGNGGSNSDTSNKGNNRNNDEVTLSGEVVDDVIEVKKAESCSIEGSKFSEEENQAYLWACDKGIVIADNIMKANMNRNLTRAELAKMLSVYSEELLGRSRVKNESVTYPDVNDKLGDLAYYIQEGYKLQIMGIHADGTPLSKFSPNSSVTRGEFGTVFSRVLHGNKYNIGNSHYYEKHLEVLKSEGILTNTNPKLIEKRGWILLMLYRSQKVEQSSGDVNLEEIANTSGKTEEVKSEDNAEIVTGENTEVETGNNIEVATGNNVEPITGNDIETPSN